MTRTFLFMTLLIAAIGMQLSTNAAAESTSVPVQCNVGGQVSDGILTYEAVAAKWNQFYTLLDEVSPESMQYGQICAGDART